MQNVESQSQGEPLLEVIACSVEDAIEAEKGSAHRLEIISDFERGGLTPSVEVVRDILAAVQLPVRVMLRESDGYEVKSDAEIERLCMSTHQLSALPIEGVVLGFLRHGKVDRALMTRVLYCAQGKRATFHHAFDETENPLEAIEMLKGYEQVDRILTSGGSGSWKEKAERLALYERMAQPQIKILAGGGIDERAIEAICGATAIREFHVGRAARIPSHSDGPVQATRVAELVGALKGSTRRELLRS